MSKIGKLTMLVLGLVLVLGIAGCSNPDGEGAKVVDCSASAATKPAEPAKQGTRENPLPLGTTAKIGDWDVTVTKVNTDAGAVVKKANEFNEAAKSGNKYVVATAKAKYTGTESGTFWVDMSAKFYGSGGNTFDTASVVLPNPIADTGETFPGAEVTGDMVFEVPANQIDGGAIIIEASFIDGSRTFWAVK